MKFKHLIHSKKFSQFVGVMILACLITYGVVAKVKIEPNPNPTPNNNGHTTAGWQQAGYVQAKLNLSQNKVLQNSQNSDGDIYLQIDLEALNNGEAVLKKRLPTDFIVVLDRSGSMSGKGKIDYARNAVISLMKQLKPEDGFSLVTFDDRVETPIKYIHVNSDNISELTQIVQNISPRGSTDLGSGLKQGIETYLNMKDRAASRSRRVILVSDGQANVGITDPKQLNKMASQAVKGEFVISTIGVGLDFNETLLASIADFGTGSYYFLEKPSGMDKVLAQEFYGASQVFAKNLKIKFNLASGFKVQDVSGYPILNEGRYQIVRPGHLYREQKKSLFVTLKVPTNTLYSESLGQVFVSYEVNGKAHELSLVDSKVTVACLPPAKKQEVIASIDKDTYGRAWAENNSGLILKEGSGYIKRGEYKKAKSIVQKFKEKLGSAYDAAPSPQIANQMKEMDELEQKIDDTIASGGLSSEEQKSMSKDMQYKGINKQRMKK